MIGRDHGPLLAEAGLHENVRADTGNRDALRRLRSSVGRRRGVDDDWGLSPPRDQERRDLLEILEDRCGQRSTVMTSQLPTKQWHEHLADQTIADTILDRILNNAHRLVLKGPTRRIPEAKEKRDTDR